MAGLFCYHQAMTAYDKAVSLLAAREHTEKEIRNKLDARFFTPSDIDEAVERIKREGYLSEERFAEIFIRSRLRKLPEGRAILSMRLRERGCPDDISRRALAEAWEREDYLEPLVSYLDELIRKKGEDSAYAALYRKGFTSSEVRKAKEALSERTVDELE